MKIILTLLHTSPSNQDGVNDDYGGYACPLGLGEAMAEHQDKEAHSQRRTCQFVTADYPSLFGTSILSTAAGDVEDGRQACSQIFKDHSAILGDSGIEGSFGFSVGPLSN